MTKLVFANGKEFIGKSFGAKSDSVGSLVIHKANFGIEQTLTDPTYKGYIVLCMQPHISVAGVPSSDVHTWGFAKNFESERVQASGVVCLQASMSAHHHAATSSIHTWLEHHKVPGIMNIDTIAVQRLIEQHGTMQASIVQDDNASVSFTASDAESIPQSAGCSEVKMYTPIENLTSEGKPIATLAVVDCGVNNSFIRTMLKRGIQVYRVPHAYDLSQANFVFNGVCISSGPGDPNNYSTVLRQVQWCIAENIPLYCIGLGAQILTLAIGGRVTPVKTIVSDRNIAYIQAAIPKVNSQNVLSVAECVRFTIEPDSLPAEYVVWWHTKANAVVGYQHNKRPIFAFQGNPTSVPTLQLPSVIDPFLQALQA